MRAHGEVRKPGSHGLKLLRGADFSAGEADQLRRSMAAMLNSQPLGFYGPAQLVQDAQRHGAALHALRLGLRRVSGLPHTVAHRIATERQKHPFASTQNLALCCQVNEADLKALASAEALQSLSGHRRQQPGFSLTGALAHAQASARIGACVLI